MLDKPTQRQPIRVSYEAKNGARETTTASDLSLGGVFIETAQKSPAIGAFVALEIESGSTKVAIDGRVLSTSPTGFAVRFIDLPNDVASALSFILATRMPRRGTTLGLGEAEEGVAKYVSERSLPTAPSSAPAVVTPAPPPPAPTPKTPVMPVEPAAPRPPPPRVAAAAPAVPPVVPPAPTSSAPAVMSIGTPRPSAPPMPPPAPMRTSRPPPGPSPFAQLVDAAEMPRRSRAPIVIAIVAIAVVGLIATIALLSR